MPTEEEKRLSSQPDSPDRFRLCVDRVDEVDRSRLPHCLIGEEVAVPDGDDDRAVLGVEQGE
jgi:hypothetical protein